MKTLIIDSHKSTSNKPPDNLHYLNAKAIADRIGADLIWSYPEVNDNIVSDYDTIIFNHSSHYAYVDYAWVEASPNAKLYSILNDYNLGESRLAWMAYKRAGRKHTVIASVSPDVSKIVTKYTEDWHKLNLNSLIVDLDIAKNINNRYKESGIYYGSFRKGREEYFKKYLDGMLVSTHSKNREKFTDLGIAPQFINRINWSKEGLTPYKTSLYIEDIVSHKSYTYLANRFYEALNYNVIPLFDANCLKTIELSDYTVPQDYVINTAKEFQHKTKYLPNEWGLQLEIWREQADGEKQDTLQAIENILTNG